MLMQTKITALLIDDEQDSRTVLRRLVSKYFPEIEFVGEAASADEGYQMILQEKPKLVFLDIQMPLGSGFNLLAKFTVIPFEIIFVTSYDQYAINAIRFNALDYLLKPVDTKELQNAVDKAIATIVNKADSNTQIINLLHTLSSNEISERRIAIHSGEKVKMHAVKDILYIEADGRYSVLTMNSDETYMTPRTLKEFEDYLDADPNFIRISKSVIIRINAIKEYSKGYPCFVEILNGKLFEIPRRKKQEILEKFRTLGKKEG